jgi:late competence protein required for DNA uptake (superfamily II DNA/RNA helicase)
MNTTDKYTIQSPNGDANTTQSPVGDYRCQRCYSTATKLGAGKALHTASLLCAECDRWIKWVGKAELVKLTGGAR